MCLNYEKYDARYRLFHIGPIFSTSESKKIYIPVLPSINAIPSLLIHPEYYYILHFLYICGPKLNKT